MANKRTRGPARSRDEWTQLVKAWKASGLTAALVRGTARIEAKSLVDMAVATANAGPPAPAPLGGDDSEAGAAIGCRSGRRRRYRDRPMGADDNRWASTT